MQARRAARELALILFSQFDKEITKYSRKDFEDIMLKSVRILSNSASEELKLTVGSLLKICLIHMKQSTSQTYQDQWVPKTNRFKFL